MTSSIILTLLFRFYNCYIRYIILDTFSTISLWTSITKQLNSLSNLPLLTKFYTVLTTFLTHIVPYDNIRFDNSFVVFGMCPLSAIT